MSCSDVVVLGGGIAGLGAARQLRERGLTAQIFDRRERLGGVTSSTRTSSGFTFDEGAHVSFTKNMRVREILESSIDGEIVEGKVYCNNYWQGHWAKHPIMVNMHGLPESLVQRCITEFANEKSRDPNHAKNYRDWLIAAFGSTFSEVFPLAYTRKYHTTDAENLTTDWLGQRLYRPSLHEIERGSREHEPFDVHYVNSFRYPAKGGFEGFLKGLSMEASYNGMHEIAEIDLSTKTLRFTNGRTRPYGQIISSLPLPVLVASIRQAPEAIREAAKRLACSQAVTVNIGLSRPVETKAQWTYFYDEAIPFARTSFPGNLSPENVPAGSGSIQAEIYFSEKYRPQPLSFDSLVEACVDALVHCGLIRNRGDIVEIGTTFIPFANVIFDHDRRSALKAVNSYLDSVGIERCGRYGQWQYMWTDGALLSGEKAVSRILRSALNQTA